MRRVVVTGLGCISPLGNSPEEFWANALEGVSGAAFNPLFEAERNKIPVNFSCQVKNFEPTDYLSAKHIRRIDSFLLFAICASDQAIKNSGLSADNADPDRIGTLIGTGIGGVKMICDWQVKCESKPDYSRLTPFFVPGVISNMASGEVSIRYGFKGPCLSISTACTTGTHSIGESMRMIRHGVCDAMVCGGSENINTPLVVAGFACARALSRRNDDPQRASRPYDIDRDGFVLGEGSSILVLEEYEHAKRRGARIFAEVKGYAANADAHHITSPVEDGSGAAKCMAAALKDAGINADQINYINSHGTSTPLGDVAEIKAINSVFSKRAGGIPISSTKSMTGHLLGASGSLEAIACIKSLESQKIHPTINVENQDPECDIDCVREGARDTSLNYVLSNSFGFGGTNGSLILSSA